MKKNALPIFWLFSIVILLSSCNSGVNPIQYNDEIIIAQEKLLEEQVKLEKAINAATGDPAQKEAAEKLVSEFEQKAQELIGRVNTLEKLDNDEFKQAFVKYTEGMVDVVKTDYKTMLDVASIKEEEFTEELGEREEDIMAQISSKLEKLDNDLEQAQDAFAKRHDIHLQR